MPTRFPSLCHSCTLVRHVFGRLGQRYLLCESDRVPERYPVQPRLRCAHYRPASHDRQVTEGRVDAARPEPVVLETARLRLRPHRADDLPAVTALWSDPEVVRHITGVPQPEELAWQRLLRYAGHWELMGFGYWALEERDTGRFVGEVGLMDFRRAIDPPLGPDPEMGWVLRGDVHGRGYATEAGLGVLAWRDRALPGDRTVCIIAPVNEASIRVSAKLGFRETGAGLYHGQETLRFERLRPMQSTP